MRAFLLCAAALAFASLCPVAAVRADDTTKAINQFLADSWKTNNLKPAERTSDAEFVRRVYLDIVGRIPRVEEIRDFEKDNAADKRAKLIDRLLASPEYVEYWADVWTAWLVGRDGQRLYEMQLHLWLADQLTEKVSYKDMVVKLLTATGKTNDNAAVNFLLAHVGAENGIAPPKARPSPEELNAIREKEGQFTMIPATVRTARLFLGYRLQGLDIPDHQPEKADWTDAQFWQLNVFFRQVEREGHPAINNPRVVPPLLTLKDNGEFNKKGTLFYLKANGISMPAEAVFLDGRKMPKDGKATRREVLAGFVTSHDNFTKAYVNRMWGHFFGRGLHEKPAVDDFGSQNKVVHPELLDRLAKDFAADGQQPKALIRWICNSDAYQLKSVGNETNTKPETERYFSRMPLKLLSAEQLANTMRIILQPDPKANIDAQKKLLDQLTRSLRGRGEEGVREDLAFHDRLIQAMYAINRREVSDAVLDPDSGPIARAAQEKDPLKGLELLYAVALGRSPTDREINLVQPEIKKATAAGDAELKALWQDLFWALLNSSEFILNH